MRKPTFLSVAVFALLQAAGMAIVNVVSAEAALHVSVLADGNASTAGSGGNTDPTDHGSNSSVLTVDKDPVQQEDFRPHVSKEVEEAAEGR